MSDMSAIVRIIKDNPKLLSEIGDCPNVEFPTVGGKLFWKDERVLNGWKLQYNYLTGLFRIIDENNIRKAWGSPNVMEEKFKRLTRGEFLEPGDVIGVSRSKALNIYEHYAVYIGDGQVVHYSGSGNDFKGKIVVKKDSLQKFLKSDKYYFVLYFDKSNLSPHKIQSRTSFNMSDVDYGSRIRLKLSKDFKLYSPEETVSRALSRLGEDKYNLVLNNCEHFAIWCKTGVSESLQVDRVIYNIIASNLPKRSIV